LADSLFSLQDKVAIVTGATRGIGRALSFSLARAQAAVVLLGRDAAALAATRAEIEATGGSALSLCADVGSPAMIDAAFEAALRWRGRIDILINNAGVEKTGASLELSEATWDLIVDTNLKGAFFCAQAAARRMPQGGSILNVCSLTSEVGIAGAAPYGASKAGLAGLTRALATEWASKRIRVNGIGPGYFRTAMTEGFYADARWQQAMLQKIPLGRFGRLEDLGGAAVFLCSDAAAYVTGQILYIDGGVLGSL
jgi:NAD(P)-dependent dehydrogenase (short-subunit alcohol dehydrogenase family)